MEGVWDVAAATKILPVCNTIAALDPDASLYLLIDPDPMRSNVSAAFFSAVPLFTF